MTIKKVKWDEIQNLIMDYYAELGYKNDGFHNGMMLDGEPHIITCNGEIFGFFSIGNSWNNGKMFRAFYIIPSERREAADIFNQLIADFNIEAALVASNDAHLISLAFEKMNALHTGFDMQAYNFVYGESAREAEYGMDCLTLVTPNEYERMNSLTELQWNDSFGDENFKFYALKDNDEILGYGSIYRLSYNQKNVDVGNYTLPKHRRKGVGRSIIINMSKLAAKEGLSPVAGCWYGNTESVATLKSSGFIPENRIFYVRFS